MLLEINYGGDKLELRFPDSLTIDRFECKASVREVDSHAFLGRIGMTEKELFPINQADLFVVNDAYRPTPTADILRRLSESRRISKKARFIVATGCHGAPTESQLEAVFGEMYPKLKNRILIHDARNLDSMVSVGEDESDNAIYLNREFVEAGKVVVIGSVEPHYFAGFTGGRKSIFPGLCDYETTVRNHRLATSFDASPVKLEGNPVEQNLRELMKLVKDKQIFSIQLLLDKKGQMHAFYCGDIDSSFQRACEQSRDIFSTKVKDRYDLLLAEVRPPLDANLYQLQKSLENSQQAVANGGTMILFSPCREGIGSDSFYKLVDKWQAFQKNSGRRKHDFGIHKLSRVAQIAQRIDVRLYSDLDDGIPDKVFYKTEKNPQEIINNLTRNKKGIRIACVNDAAHTVLRSH